MPAEVEWTRSYPNGLSGGELYRTVYNGYELKVWAAITRNWKWVLVADPKSGTTVAAGMAPTRQEAQTRAIRSASDFAAGNWLSDLLPSELLMAANKKNGSST